MGVNRTTSTPDPDPFDRSAADDARPVAPFGRIGESLGMLADIERALDSRTDLLRRVQRVTGLCYGELQALAVIAAGGRDAATLAEATGQVPGAVDATVESLRARGMVEVRGGTGAVLRVTAAGRVAIQRAEGMQVRLADVVVSGLTQPGTQHLREALRAVPDAVRGPDRPAAG